MSVTIFQTMITQTYQKSYEGENLEAAANGVILFYVLKDCTMQSVKVGVREGNPVGSSIFELRKAGTLITTITIPTTALASTITELATPLLAGDELTLNLIGVNGGYAATPIYMQVEMQEAGTSFDADNFPVYVEGLPINDSVEKDDEIVTRKAATGLMVKSFPLDIKSYFDKSTAPVPIIGGIIDVDDIGKDDDARIIPIESTANITQFIIAEGKSRYFSVVNTGGQVTAGALIKIVGGSFVRKAGMMFEVIGLAGGVAQIINNNQINSLGDVDQVANKTRVQVIDQISQIQAIGGVGVDYSTADFVEMFLQGVVGVGRLSANLLKLGGATVHIGNVDELGGVLGSVTVMAVEFKHNNNRVLSDVTTAPSEVDSKDYVYIKKPTSIRANDDVGVPEIIQNAIKHSVINGKDAYAFDHYASPTDYGVYWTGTEWRVMYNGGTRLYYSTNNVLTPNLVTTWIADIGVAPLPVFTLQVEGQYRGTRAQLAKRKIQVRYDDFTLAVGQSGDMFKVQSSTMITLPNSANAIAGETVFYLRFDDNSATNGIQSHGSASDYITYIDLVANSGVYANSVSGLLGHYVHEIRWDGVIWAGNLLTA